MPIPSLPPFTISPPLLNSSNPWATTKSDLLALYASPHTGAVTTRTSLWGGFPNDPKVHQYVFFSPSTGHATVAADVEHIGCRDVKPGSEAERCSLNTLGYSPVSFESYVAMLREVVMDGSLETARKASGRGAGETKPFIVSVTGSDDEVARCLEELLGLLNDGTLYSGSNPDTAAQLDLMMEINLSCPNIPSKPPPAYDLSALNEYISAIAGVKKGLATAHPGWRDMHVGIKTPPYTHAGEFKVLIGALEGLEVATGEGGRHPISFVTACNTLGSCLVMGGDAEGNAIQSANGNGIGGMAGEALHPLALGNVRILRGMLDASTNGSVNGIAIIGIGGVSDAAGWKRMKAVGAAAVGVGTALGVQGVGVFERIAGGL